MAETLYKKQKESSYIYLRVKYSDKQKINDSQFTIYDFVSNLFPKSKVKQELAIKIFEELKKEPCTFRMLVQRTGARKSTLYTVCLSMLRSGVINRKTKREPFMLSNSFSSVLRDYSYWWERWISER